MIWHASWHAALQEHMAGSSGCFLLGISNGNVSSHSIDDAHPQTSQCCWGLSKHPISHSSGWRNELFMLFHTSNHRDRESASPRRGEQYRKFTLKLWCHSTHSQAFSLQLWNFIIKKKIYYQGRYQSFKELGCAPPSQHVLTDRRVYQDLPCTSQLEKQKCSMTCPNIESGWIFKDLSISRIPLQKWFILYY